jgi:outer membrane protein TolC
MAEAGYLPVIGLGGAYETDHHERPFGEDGKSWQVTAFLRWELFDGTKREHERSKAKYQIAETGEYLEGLKKQISFQIYEAYLTVEAERKRRELAEHALKSAEEGRRLVRKRYENSLSTMVDLLDAQTNLDATRANVVEKEGAYLTAVANLGFQSGTILKDLGVESPKEE